MDNWRIMETDNYRRITGELKTSGFHDSRWGTKVSMVKAQHVKFLKNQKHHFKGSISITLLMVAYIPVMKRTLVADDKMKQNRTKQQQKHKNKVI